MTIIYQIAFFLTLLWSGFIQAQVDLDDPLLTKATITPFQLSPGQGAQLRIEMTLPKGFHAYKEEFKVSVVSPLGLKVSQPQIEPIVRWFDKYSQKDREGIKDSATLTAHLEAPLEISHAVKNVELELMYQACSDQFCLFPIPRKLQIPISIQNNHDTVITSATGELELSPPFFSLESFYLKLRSGLFTALFFVFLAGIFTSFTPCIFPMIPITLAVLGQDAEKQSRFQNFLKSIFYVLGIATTYSILGIFAAMTGGLFGASLGSPVVLSLICALFLAMALSMYGLYDLQVPAFIRNQLGNRSQNKNLLGAYITGLFAGIVASPCVGPVLVGILAFVATSKDIFKGFLFLFTYAIGLGLIFIVLGLSNQLVKKLPRSGPWLNFSKFILGSLMLGAFYYYLDLLVPSRVFDFILGIGLISLAAIYGAFDVFQGKPLQALKKAFLQTVLLVGMFSIVLSIFNLRPFINAQFQAQSPLNKVEAVQWLPYSEENLKKAQEQNKPIIIDFWAEWCAACHEMLEKTFPHPRVAALAEQFVLLKFDATKESEELKKLRKKYGIIGLPTFIFIDAKGKWRTDLTLTQFEEPVLFSRRMEKILQKEP